MNRSFFLRWREPFRSIDRELSLSCVNGKGGALLLPPRRAQTSPPPREARFVVLI